MTQERLTSFLLLILFFSIVSLLGVKRYSCNSFFLRHRLCSVIFFDLAGDLFPLITIQLLVCQNYFTLHSNFLLFTNIFWGSFCKNQFCICLFACLTERVSPSMFLSLNYILFAANKLRYTTCRVFCRHGNSAIIFFEFISD